MKPAKPAGVILAGGRSSRMRVTRKALLELHGQTLLERVIDRFQSQTEPLLISCESDTGDFDAYGLTVVPDLLPGFHGPLIGLYSA
jgi:molybdopterin-guanine dinucleotide biosynthesis protein A